jgi:inorganic pyrophosphatase/exopolyphosphatase
MARIIVTADKNFTDIDILASVISYTELLGHSGVEAIAVIVGPLNTSVPEEVLSWDLKYSSTYNKEPDDKYIIVDRSDNTDVFPDFVESEKILEIIDHHLRLRGYWKKRLGNRAIIESVGACATLIWEKFKENNLENKITQTSARLLYSAILSNTLDFKAFMTDDRDITAADRLIDLAKLPGNWKEIYFTGCKKKLLERPEEAIRRDVKTYKLNTGEKITIGQIELWESKDFIENNRELIAKVLSGYGNELWFMSSPSISEGINYVFATNPLMKKWLKESVEAEFTGDIGKTKSLWLRKELRFRE